MILDRLYKQGAIHPPKYVLDSQYLVIMGSEAYGVASAQSDVDIYGFCIPPRSIVFPHESGAILGFGKQPETFHQWTEHHVKDPSKQAEYDFSVYNIIKYFQLCMDNNPNMLDSLFVPNRCILYSSPVGNHVRDNRRVFLHKGSFHKMKGYAYQQLSKIKNKVNYNNEKRKADIEQFGYSLKYAMHLIRLVDEAEQILTEHDLDIERNREQLKSIRRGEWSLDRVKEYFVTKEKSLQEVYQTSTLRVRADEATIKKILFECLEMHFGSLQTAVIVQPNLEKMINELRGVIDRYSSS